MATGNISWVKETQETQYPTSEGFQVPRSCCERFDKVNDCRKTPTADAFKVEGCMEKLADAFTKNKDVILAVGVTVVVIMVSL